jgi:hypothetical protein
MTVSLRQVKPKKCPPQMPTGERNPAKNVQKTTISPGHLSQKTKIPQALRHHAKPHCENLNLARLPIPPRAHKGFQAGGLKVTTGNYHWNFI